MSEINKCPYDNDGKCDITGKDCKDVILCTPETVYMDKKYGNTRFSK